jgi:hypothetical protein
LRILVEVCQCGLYRIGVVRLFALDDRRDAADGLALILHERLAVSERIGACLCRKNCDGKQRRRS